MKDLYITRHPGERVYIYPPAGENFCCEVVNNGDGDRALYWRNAKNVKISQNDQIATGRLPSGQAFRCTLEWTPADGEVELHFEVPDSVTVLREEVTGEDGVRPPHLRSVGTGHS